MEFRLGKYWVIIQRVRCCVLCSKVLKKHAKKLCNDCRLNNFEEYKNNYHKRYYQRNKARYRDYYVNFIKKGLKKRERVRSK